MRKAYKLFDKRRDGTLHALFIEREKVYPVGEWLFAVSGPRTEDGKVKSKLGKLAYRPGFHFTFDIPHEVHIGKKENGKIKYMPKNYVWCEIEYSTEIDYTPLARERGKNIFGKVIARKACLDFIPLNGFYEYTTNPNAVGVWGISGEMKIIRELTDDEVLKLCHEAGVEPLEREK